MRRSIGSLSRFPTARHAHGDRSPACISDLLSGRRPSLATTGTPGGRDSPSRVQNSHPHLIPHHPHHLEQPRATNPQSPPATASVPHAAPASPPAPSSTSTAAAPRASAERPVPPPGHGLSACVAPGDAQTTRWPHRGSIGNRRRTQRLGASIVLRLVSISYAHATPPRHVNREGSDQRAGTQRAVWTWRATDEMDVCWVTSGSGWGHHAICTKSYAKRDRYDAGQQSVTQLALMFSNDCRVQGEGSPMSSVVA